MPLLMSPIDGSPMKQIHRYGIEIDVCPTSGGIWMDKGELEKLMVLLKEEDVSRLHAAHTRISSGSRYQSEYDDDDGYERHHERSHKKKKMSKIMDIFDF